MRYKASFALAAFILLAILAEAQAASYRGFFASRLRSLAGAIWTYESVHDAFPTQDICDAQGKPLLSWRVRILPFIESDLHKSFRLNEPWDSPHNRQFIDKVPGVFRDEFHERWREPKGKTRVVALRGPHTFFGTTAPRRLADLRNNLSTTVMLVEVDLAYAPIWTKPEDLVYDSTEPARGLSSEWTSGLFREKSGFVIMADQSSRSLPSSSDPEMLRALFTLDPREPIQDRLPFYAVLDRQPLGLFMATSLSISAIFILGGVAIAVRVFRLKPTLPGEWLFFVIAMQQAMFVPAFMVCYRYDLLPPFYGRAADETFEFILLFLPAFVGMAAAGAAAVWHKQMGQSLLAIVFGVYAMALAFLSLESLSPHQFWMAEETLASLGRPFLTAATALVLAFLGLHHSQPQDRAWWHWLGLTAALVPVVWYFVCWEHGLAVLRFPLIRTLV